MYIEKRNGYVLYYSMGIYVLGYMYRGTWSESGSRMAVVLYSSRVLLVCRISF
jgi:hypothetical protein